MPDAAIPGRIVTFYSYKGGTGRTMLLANVAWILASRGKRVLMIDWDLEAPGLHHYFHPFLRDRQLRQTDGLVEMVLEHATRVVTPDMAAVEQSANAPKDAAVSEPVSPSIPPLPAEQDMDPLDYVVGLDWPSFAPGGQLHLMPAGQQDSTYSTRVNSFDWRDYYDRLGGGTFFEHVRTILKSKYDYVLIDSRTGVSDTSGICTVQMPDRLVVCFAMSEANIIGGAATAAFVRTQWLAKGREAVGCNIFPIATRVDLGEKEKLNAAMAHVRALFTPVLAELPPDRLDAHFKQAQVLYLPYYAFEETLAVFGDRSATAGSLLASSEAVARMISDGEVTELAPPTDLERAKVLDAYERKSGEAPVAAEWLVSDDDLQAAQGLAGAMRREYGLRSGIVRRDDRLQVTDNPGTRKAPLILVLGADGGKNISVDFWKELETLILPKGLRPLIIVVLQSAPADLALPRTLAMLPRIDLRERADVSEAVIRLRYAISGGEIVPPTDKRIADLRLERRLREAATAWEERNRSEDFLLRGTAFREIEDFVKRANMPLSGVVQDFLQASRDYLERASKMEQLTEQVAASEAKQSHLRRAVLAAALGMVLALGATIWTLLQLDATIKRSSEQVEQTARVMGGQIAERDDRLKKLGAENSEREASIKKLNNEKDLRNAELSAREVQVAELTSTRDRLITEAANRKEQEGLELRLREAEISRLIRDREVKELIERQRILGYLSSESSTALGNGKPMLATQLALQAAIRSDATESTLDALRQTLALLGGQPVLGNRSRVVDLAISGDGRRFAILTFDDQMIVWDAQSLKQVVAPRRIETIFSEARVALSQDGNTAAVLIGIGPLRLLEISSMKRKELKPRSEAPGKTSSVRVAPPEPKPELIAVAIETGGRVIAVSPAGTAQVWDSSKEVATDRWQLRGWKGVETGRGRLVALVNRTLGLVNSNGALAIWDLGSSNAEPWIYPLNDPFSDYTVSLAPNAHYLVASTDRRRVLLDIAKREAKDIFSGFERDSISAMAVDPSGRTVVATRDSAILVWDVERRAMIAQLHGHDAPITAIQFSPNGQQLFSADREGLVRAWNVPADFRTGARPGPVSSRQEGQTGPPPRDSRSRLIPTEVALGAFDKMPLPELLAVAERLLGRNMDCGTWKRYFPMDQYVPAFQDLPAPDCGSASAAK